MKEKVVKESMIAYYDKIKDHSGEVAELDMYSNFVNMPIPLKIAVLDAIIDHAKDVFGPLSGVYGEIDTTNMNKRMSELNTSDVLFAKSSDGHEFFNKLSFGTKYGTTILKLIQQHTKFVSGYDGETSRDGTTSLGIIASLMSKHMLTSDYMNGTYSKLPKKIKEIMQQSLVYAGTELLTQYKIPVYDKEKREYLPGGFDKALKTIATTVAGNPLFINAFSKAMKECENGKLDIMSAFKAKPENRYGDLNVDVEIECGIKMRATSLASETAAGFKANYSTMIVLDGFVKEHYANIFKQAFLKWIVSFLGTKDPKTGIPIFSDMHPNKLGTPVILVTRTPDYLKDMYEELAKNGVTISFMHNGSRMTTKIVPHLLIAYDVDVLGIYYQDAKEVFKDSIIDINAIHRYMQSVNPDGKEEYDMYGIPVKIPIEKYKDFPIDNFFPDIEGVNLVRTVPTNKSGVWIEKMGVDNPEENKYADNGEVVSVPFINTCMITGYNGEAFLMNPTEDELKERIAKKRAELIEARDSFSKEAFADNALEERLDFFSGVTIKPVLTYRTHDEFIHLYNLYEDALGVFESIHGFGIMPGANSFFIKKQIEFFERAHDVFITTLKNNNISESKIDTYSKTLSNMLVNILDAYVEAYKLLDSEEDNHDRVVSYIDGETEFSKVYDVVTGDITDNVYEAAKTTADVFVSGLSIAFDLLGLKRIRVDSYNEWLEVSSRSNVMHARNYKENIREEK